jgi:3-hydroxyisobutyrate dehydrogenase-like beta-hydroxyacid dehydrogenase
VFGIGEAGSEIASGLVATGAHVVAYDPAPVTTPAGVVRCNDPREAVERADVVLSIVAATDAETALRQALEDIPAGCQYADLATASPGLKRSLSATASAAGVVYTDVALMGTVPGRGIATPALASGPGAGLLAESMATVGMKVSVVGDEPGLAATHKLVRSVFVKGLAAVLIEAMGAAEAAGLRDETWTTIVDQVETADEAFLGRLMEGTRHHALRRHDEMQAAESLLRDLGVDPVMTAATMSSLQRAVENGDVVD